MGGQLEGDAGQSAVPPPELFEQHREKLYRRVLKKVGDPLAADDLVQEIYLRYHRGYDSLKDKAALGGWLVSIADNLCIDYFRSAARHRSALHDRREEDEQPQADAPDYSPTPLQVAEKAAQST